ncbi:hypothetical protein HDE_10351 [Halotydeus destructor]|nr:hypothetical protein HDE_10351 [Halotydeus destructor]
MDCPDLTVDDQYAPAVALAQAVDQAVDLAQVADRADDLAQVADPAVDLAPAADQAVDLAQAADPVVVLVPEPELQRAPPMLPLMSDGSTILFDQSRLFSQIKRS